VSEESLRIDRWLWFARFFKSRSTAQRVVEAARVRVGGRVVDKASFALKPGDVLTFPQGPHIRTVRVTALGTRRGPAAEAQALYDDLAPPVAREASPADEPPAAARDPGTGRPTKADRRAIDRLKGD